VFVEVKTPGGWLTVNEIAPTADQSIDAWKSKDLPVKIPSGNEQWRLRVAYGDELRGPGLFLAKVDFAIHEHRIPGLGFGVFAGSNSLSSAEISK